MSEQASITELPLPELIEATRRWWGAYMYEECADRGYNPAASRQCYNAYSEHSAECERRGVHPFVGVPYPRQAWPADWYRKAKEQGFLPESEN